MCLEDRIVRILEEAKVRVAITVPCRFFTRLIKKLQNESSIKVILPAREEEGLGIAAGCYLGGERTVLIIQNSGLGNMVNVIKSLNQYFAIPFFAFVSYRGGRDEKIEAQKPMGEVSEKLLDTLGVRTRVLKSADEVEKIREELKAAAVDQESRVLLLEPAFWKEKNEKI